MTYRELIQHLRQADITIDTEFAVKWTVKATTKTIEKRADEEFSISLVKDPDSEILDGTDKKQS